MKVSYCQFCKKFTICQGEEAPCKPYTLYKLIGRIIALKNYLKRIVSKNKVEIEVTEYAMSQYLKYFEWYKESEWNLLKKRPQMTSKGCCLQVDKVTKDGEELKVCDKLCIAGDLLTSVKFLKTLPTWQRTAKFEQLLSLFDYLHHTIGNCLPLPEGCNKGGHIGTDNYGYKINLYKDYFENNSMVEGDEQWQEVEKRIEKNQTLGNIRNIEKRNKKLPNDEQYKPLVDYAVLRYWLKTQLKEKEWKDFIKDNYLTDFVWHNGEPLCFINGLNKITTQSAEDVEKALVQAIILIVKRGYRIVNKKTGKLSSYDLEEIKNDFEEFLKEQELSSVNLFSNYNVAELINNNHR